MLADHWWSINTGLNCMSPLIILKDEEIKINDSQQNYGEIESQSSDLLLSVQFLDPEA